MSDNWITNIPTVSRWKSLVCGVLHFPMHRVIHEEDVKVYWCPKCRLIRRVKEVG